MDEDEGETDYMTHMEIEDGSVHFNIALYISVIIGIYFFALICMFLNKYR